jgi:hypothetical protein
MPVNLFTWEAESRRIVFEVNVDKTFARPYVNKLLAMVLCTFPEIVGR